MTEFELIKKVFSNNEEYTISIGTVLYLKYEQSRYTVLKYKYAAAPKFELVIESSYSFNALESAVKKFIEIRHEYEIGFDYERKSVREDCDD